MDGWDDDVFDDEDFDDIHVGNDVGAPTATPAPPAVPAAAATEPTTTATDAVSTGWGSSIQSFKQHHELNLSMSPLPIKSATGLAPMEDSYGGWSDDGLNISNEPAEDDANNQSAGKEGVFSRAAGAFGAALLASMDQDGDIPQDDDESNHDEEDDGGDGPLSYGGFGGGFVMKGLQGFIKAATTPQKDEGDGWDEEDDLDLEDDWEEQDTELDEETDQGVVEPALHEEPTHESGWDESDLQHIEEPELHEEPANEGGWDDFDLNVSDKAEKDNEVSDSLRDFVAKTESALNSAFLDASRTPRKSPRDECVVAAVTTESAVADEIDGGDDGAVSKSLTDFVDTLDAELQELQGGLETVVAKEESGLEATVPSEEVYNFDENKDKSPEPVKGKVKLNLPHQDSWYLNAMEGGKGGVIYADQTIQSNFETRKDPMLPVDDSGLSMIDVAEPTPVGMPLSEMPSVVNSENNSQSSSNADFSSWNGCNFQQSELQCKCLELILPLPDNGSVSSPLEETESGFGTKTLPDGTTVLVNYEKLLQNEATKRILLQRSVETYERTMEKMQTRHHALMKTSQENEEARQLLDSQLGAAQNENMHLRELVHQLQTEKEYMNAETPSSEAHLFQEELSAAAIERERLEKQVESLDEQLRLAHQQHEVDMESRLEEIKTEHSRLEQLVKAMQSDMLESQQTCSLLKSENDALQAKIIASTESASNETACLKVKITALESELREKASDCDVLNSQINEMTSEQANHAVEKERLIKENDMLSASTSEIREKLVILEHENETLRSMQNDSEARVAELAVMIESTENLSEEVDRLTAENASLSYELRVKSTENDDYLAALKSLQSELDAASAHLSAFDQTSNNHDASSEIENLLRAENEVLKTNLADLQSDLTSVGRSKADLELSLEERIKHIGSVEAELENLQTQVSLVTQLQSEVVDLREALDRTEQERRDISLLKEDLNTQLVAAQNSHQALVHEIEEKLAHSQEETATIWSQIDEVRRHNSDTMGHMEEQLAGLMQQNAALTSQLEEYRIELERVQEENAKVTRSNSEKESQYAQHVFNLEGENLELSAALKIAHEASSSSCNLESNGSELRVKELEEDVKFMQENIQSLLSTIEELQETKDDLVRDNDNLSLALKNATITDGQDNLRTVHETAELCTSINQYQKAISDAEQVISDLKAQNQALQDSMTVGHSELQSNFDDLSDEYEETRQAFVRVQMEKGNLQARNRALEQDNKSLEFQLSESSIKSNQVLAQSRALEQENKSLKLQLKEASSKVHKLEANVFELEAQLEDQEKEAVDAISQWEAQCKSLEDGQGEKISLVEHSSVLEERDRLQQEVYNLGDRVNELTTHLTTLQVSHESNAAEKEKLFARITELEQELKDDNVNELRDELTSLHEERQQLDLDNEELLVQLGLMQQSKLEHDEEVQDELTSLRSQVATLQDNLANLQQELEESRSGSVSNGEGTSEVVDKLHRENVELQNHISRLSSEKGSLEDDIKDLAMQQQQHQTNQGFDSNQGFGDTEAAAAKENMNQEIKQLKTTLRELELKLVDKEQEATSAKEEMKRALEQKDEDILKLTTEGFLRETTLKDMTRHVEAKNVVDSMQINFGADRSDLVVEEDEEKDYNDDDSLQDLLADNIESDDYLRDQIVILAQALERSELQRADVLDRLTRERKLNADSLKQLGESVKRFYSAVRCSDTLS